MKAISFLILICLIFDFSISKAQTSDISRNTQTVRGKIVDDVSKNPVGYAIITLVSIEKKVSTQSNESGEFELQNVPLGRQTFSVSFLGYESRSIPDVFVTAGKEVILTISLTESISKLNEVEITYSRKDDPTVTNNEMSTVSSRSFNLEDTKKYAGSLGDPSRMAANFAGVVAGNDSRNDIVVRGNSPNAMLWQLEGINIPNPNHFGSTFNTGGPVSMLNSNNLAKSDFFTSAFPAQYGNAIGGVFDVQLREGNNQKNEFVAQIGFNGFELGAEGPFSKTSKGSYLINYRYSTLGLFDAIGISFGTGGAIPLYQDLNFKAVFPTKGNGKLSFFGMGGISSIDFFGKDVDTTEVDYYSEPDENLSPRYNTGIAGVSYEKTIRTKTFLKATLGYSIKNDNYKIDSVSLTSDDTFPEAKGTFNDGKYSAILTINHKINAKNSINAGLNHDLRVINFNNKDFENGIERVFVDQKDNVNLSQGFVQFKHRFDARLTLVLGLHSQYFDLNDQIVAEPRVGLKYLIDENSSLSAGYGLHHQMLPLYNYFVKNSLGQENNKMLLFSRASHFVLGYERKLGENVRAKLETYYQELSKIPVSATPNQYSSLNIGADFAPSDEADLVNNGSGKNYGVELTIERFFNKQYYFLVTASLFDSKYKGSDGIERNTAFNTQYAANILAGKEFFVGKRNNIFYVNFKLTSVGGRYFTPINFELSSKAGEAIFDNEKAFSVKQSAYFRADLKLGYRKDYKKSSLEFAIDLQNVSGNQNIFQQGYNRRNNTISNEYQQGFFPVPMVKFTF